MGLRRVTRIPEMTTDSIEESSFKQQRHDWLIVFDAVSGWLNGERVHETPMVRLIEGAGREVN